MFGALVRHFFGRFFDSEAVSPQGEMQTNAVQILAFLAVPGFFVAFYLIPKYAVVAALPAQMWVIVPDRYFFVSYSMAVMGFVTVFEWDALFPDRRDYLILTALPIRLGTIFGAKMAALCVFIAVFALDVNSFSTVLLPVIARTTARVSTAQVLRTMAVHAATVLASGAFMAFLFIDFQGILINILSVRAFRRISPVVQMFSMGVLLVTLLVSPLIMRNIRLLIEHDVAFIYWFPFFWFLGMYETLQSGPAAHPVFQRLSGIALEALGAVFLLFLLTYAIGFGRHARRSLETAEKTGAGPGPLQTSWALCLNRFVLRHPVERATFHFISQSITRSTKHRLFLATYGAVGVAFALSTLFEFGWRNNLPRVGISREGLLIVPLTLSFFLVSGLRAGFNFPVELRANWVFQMTENESRTGHLAATRKWVILCGIAPLFALLAPFEFFFWPWRIALFHVSFGTILSLLLLEALFAGFRKVPFTCSYFPGKLNMALLAVIYLFGFTTYSYTMSELEHRLGERPGEIAVFLVAASVMLLAASRYRNVEWKREFTLAYEEEADPIVRTLNLT